MLDATTLPTPLTTTPATLECDSQQFKCQSEARCIPTSQRCDGISQCSDNSDEFNCGMSFPIVTNFNTNKEHFQILVVCESWGGKHFFSSNVNSTNHTNCTCLALLVSTGENRCSHREFRCRNNQCIDRRARCDGLNHCRDGSDEIGCGMCEQNY